MIKPCVAALLSLITVLSIAQENAAPPTVSPPIVAKAQPSDVYIGIYVNEIYNVDLKSGHFEADFFIWFRWKSDELKPLNSFQPANGRITSKDAVLEKKIGDWNYATCRVTAIIQKHFDLRRFPLDNQQFSIEIEDNENESDKLRYVSDSENSKLDPKVTLPGWVVASAKSGVTTRGYKSNYGDTSLPTGNESIYSSYFFTVEAVRGTYGYFFKLCWGLLLATLIAFMALLIKPTDLDPRFGLGIGAVFAAMANAFVISSALPDNAGLTLADEFYIVAMTFTFFTICESVLSLHWYANGNEPKSRKLDQFSLCIGIVLYLIVNAWLLMYSA